MDRSTARLIWPALLAGVASAVFVGVRLADHGGEITGLAEVGTRFSDLDPQGTEGYDGQFTFTIARTPDPSVTSAHLDRPAYRFQRILLPLLGGALRPWGDDAVAWALAGIGVLASGLGAGAVAGWMQQHGRWEGYAVGFGLWVGVVSSAGLLLNEALAYGLVAIGWLAMRRSRSPWGPVALGLALFAKETTLPFWAAALITSERRPRFWLALAGLAFAVWQGWLWVTFGEPGIGSGGALSTPFEAIPLMGFFRIGQVSVTALGVFVVIFGPTVIAPAVWGAAAAIARLRRARLDGEAWALLANAAVIVFVPFSTAREPLGLVRLAAGLVLAVLLFAAARGRARVLNYTLFYPALLALLIQR